MEPFTARKVLLEPFVPERFVVSVGLPRINPVEAVTAVPGIERAASPLFVQAFVVSLKLSAKKCMYGTSVIIGGVGTG